MAGLSGARRPSVVKVVILIWLLGSAECRRAQCDTASIRMSGGAAFTERASTFDSKPELRRGKVVSHSEMNDLLLDQTVADFVPNVCNNGLAASERALSVAKHMGENPDAVNTANSTKLLSEFRTAKKCIMAVYRQIAQLAHQEKAKTQAETQAGQQKTYVGRPKDLDLLLSNLDETAKAIGGCIHRKYPFTPNATTITDADIQDMVNKYAVTDKKGWKEEAKETFKDKLRKSVAVTPSNFKQQTVMDVMASHMASNFVKVVKMKMEIESNGEHAIQEQAIQSHLDTIDVEEDPAKIEAKIERALEDDIIKNQSSASQQSSASLLEFWAGADTRMTSFDKLFHAMNTTANPVAIQGEIMSLLSRDTQVAVAGTQVSEMASDIGVLIIFLSIYGVMFAIWFLMKIAPLLCYVFVCGTLYLVGKPCEPNACSMNG